MNKDQFAYLNETIVGLESDLAKAREEIGRLLKIQSVGEYQKNLDEIEALRLSLHQMDEINTNLKAKLSKLERVRVAAEAFNTDRMRQNHTEADNCKWCNLIAALRETEER